MCYYPKLILNRKYLPTKKNNYNPPKCTDDRLKYVAIGCGNCLECRRQKANEWRTRLLEEIKTHKYVYFVTLTICDDSFEKLCEANNTTSCNAIAAIAVRHFLERWRKKYKKSVKHWLITELGKEHDRLHLHGFIFADSNVCSDVEHLWKYGNVYIGDYCSEKTINYCVKYALKIDENHKDYKQIVLSSNGIGISYINKNKSCHTYAGQDTNETYRLPNGNVIGLPIYYRNHLFTEEQREKLWINKLNEGITYVNGIKIDISSNKGIETYNKILTQMQEQNTQLGYGDDSTEWKKKDYNITLRKLNEKSRLQKYLKNMNK